TESGGKLDALRPADLNRSGASKKQREQELNTVGNTRKDV
ncbi:hypothetical protein A2U01_0070266, partial [Trifolium medium]|nr:hypothetical protein [Trifolium medium]